MLQAKSTRAGVVGLWALIAVFMVMSLVGFGSAVIGSDRSAAVSDQSAGDQDRASDRAGAFAKNYLASWMQASGSGEDTITTYSTGAAADVPAEFAKEISYKDLTVAGVEVHESETATVTLSALLPTEVEDPEDPEKTLTQWVPSWYQVVVATDEGGMAPVGWPTPVAGPDEGEALDLGYGEDITDEDLISTVTDFLNAYIAGDGDITRYIAPGTAIEAVDPARAESVEVTGLTGDRELESPQDGDELQLAAEARYAAGEQSRPVTYYLSLTMRGGRWEVTAIETSPLVETQQGQQASEQPETNSPEPSDGASGQ